MRARLDDLDDAGALLVYADALEEEGDPRGELCVVQHRLESAPADRALREREAALLERHGHDWTGGLDRDGEVTLRWRRGFIDEARLSLDDVVFAPRSLEAVLGRLLALPAAGLIRTIVVGPCAGDDYAGTVSALATASRPSLRALVLADFPEEQDVIERLAASALGDLSSLWPALPGLERLVLRGAEMTVGALVLPRARVVELYGAMAVRALADAALPACEELILHFGWQGVRGAGSAADLAAVLDGACVPRLETLRIRHTDFTNAIAGALARAPILSRLRAIDLGCGRLSARGARAMAEARAAFAHLELLDLSDNFLSSTAAALIEGMAREVRT